MSELEPQAREIRAIASTAVSYVPTWRFVGDRVSADLAYCSRFGTDAAPDPTVALGGAWAYPLPSPAPTP